MIFGFRRKAVPEPPPAAAAGAASPRTRGNEALAQGRLDDAAQAYREAIAADAGDPLAHVNLGYVLLEQGDAAEAAASLAEAARLAGERADVLADAQFLLARARQQLGDPGEAVAAYRAALRARPAFAEATQELVRLLLAAERVPEALAAAEQGATRAPAPPALMLVAQCLHAAGRIEEALAPLDAILAADRAHFGALESRGNLLLELGRAEEALACFERVIALRGAEPESLANASAALLRLGRHDEAIARVDEVLRVQPRHRASLHNKSAALLELLRVAEARELAAAALELYPQDADLRWNLAVAHLLAGDLVPGWAAYEARWGAKGFSRTRTAPLQDRPRWTGGQSLAGRSILLHAEQGLGDSIQFLRYVPMVAARAREVLLSVQPALAPLLGALAPNCRLLRPEETPPTDFECPLLSLPHAFRTSLHDVPAEVPYLHADPARVQSWRERLPGDGRPRVGIAWSGNALHSNDRNRSIALQDFAAIATPQVQFVALQPQVRENDRAALSDWPGLFDAGPRLGDFADTAALMMVLDLVITVDTSVAHLAGALARPAWILLPHCPDWRWMLGRQDTPWYPTARLYRQPAARAWAPVLAQVRVDLQALGAAAE